MTVTQTTLWSGGGSARDALERVTQRLALLLRSLWAVYAVAMITAAVIGDGGMTLTTSVAMGAVLLWVVAIAISHRRSSKLSARAAGLDVVGGVALLTLGSTLLPRSLLGDGSTWVVLGGSLSALIAIWVLPGPLAFGSTVLVGASYLAGIYIIGHSIADPNQLQTITYLLFAWVVAAVLMEILRRSADHVDATLHDLGIAQRTYRAERARLDHRETHDRVFHDQVLAILGMVSNNGLVGRRDLLRNRCTRALARMRELEVGRDSRRFLAPSASFAEVIDEIRDLGLWIELNESGAQSGSAGHVPAAVVDAIVEAMRQSLLNVWRHAGTSAARVTITEVPGELTVVIEDDGKGFDPENIRDGARGIRNSIEGHVHDVGGTADIRSAPGNGCTVRLTYQAGRPPAAAGPATAAAGMPSGLVRYAFEVGMARAIAVIAFAWHLLSLSFLLTHADGYVATPAVLAVWAVMLAAEILLVMRAGQASFRHVTAYGATIVITCGAIAVLFLCQTRGILGYENWGLGEAGFMLAYLVMYNKLRVAAIGVAAVGLTNLVVVAAKAGPALDMGSPADSLAKVLGVILGSAAIVAGEISVYQMLRANAEIVGQAREEIDRTAAMQLATERISSDRSILYAKTDELVRPILQKLAEGTTDPDSPQVRHQCGLAESAVRRTYVTDWDNSMSRDLAAFSESAADLGVIVDLQYQAGLFAPSSAVLQSISAYLIGILAYS